MFLLCFFCVLLCFFLWLCFFCGVFLLWLCFPCGGKLQNADPEEIGAPRSLPPGELRATDYLLAFLAAAFATTAVATLDVPSV